MKNKIGNSAKYLVLTVFCFIFFLLGSVAVLADVVYLNNGKVMKGRIIEKTTEYIVLRTGQGDSAVDSTIFLEDILKMESEELYSREETLISTQLEKSSVFKKAATEQPFYKKLKPVFDNGADDIRNLIIKNRMFSANKSKEKKEGDFILATTEKMGSGSISGTIRLPETWKDHNGPLYVYLMERTAGQGYIADENIIYQKIEAGNILGRSIEYSLGNISSGSYGIFAVWDISSPAVREKPEKNGTVLINLGLKGDYVGGIEKSVDLKPDERLNNVDFDCATFLKADSVTNPDYFDLELLLKDIYYVKSPSNKIDFFMSVKNNSKMPTPALKFYVLINDEDVLGRTVDFPPLIAGEEKELDLSQVFNAYLRDKQAGVRGKKENVSGTINFKVKWAMNNEVSIEKTLYIF